MGELAPLLTHEIAEEADQFMTPILIVDDEEPVRRMLSRLLDGKGYKCTLAANATEARRCMKNKGFALVLCDIKMPGESGMDFVRYTLSECPETAVIMVSGVGYPETAETALEMGAYGYVIKPFRAKELLMNVMNALQRRKLEIQNRRNYEDLEKLVSERTNRLRETLNDLRETIDGMVEAMGMTIEVRDPYTARHQRRVAEIAYAIAQEMGISEEQTKGIRMAGLIHDIGKMTVPAEILSKPARLTENEFEMIKAHPLVGYNILKKINFPWPVSQIVYQHHERMDGSGYPQGLSGEDILLEARILAVADVVEAMASHRPYRPGLGWDKALEQISQNSGTLYDPVVADACLRLFKEKGFTLHS